MVNTFLSKNKHSILSIIIGILLLIIFVLGYRNYRLDIAMDHILTKSIIDSMEVVNYQRVEDSIFALLISENLNTTIPEIKDEELIQTIQLVLIYYQRSMDSLKRTNLSKEKNLLDLHAACTDYLDKIKLEEAQKDSLGFILESTIWNFQHSLDSLSVEINNLQSILSKTNLDSLVLKSPDGTRLFFYGKLLGGIPMGFGVGFYEKKGYYIGEWVASLRNGKGKHQYKNGDIYEGEFRDDMRNGYGSYFYATGEVYSGEWENDLMNGEGEVLTKEGKVFKGTWVNGKMIEAQ